MALKDWKLGLNNGNDKRWTNSKKKVDLVIMKPWKAKSYEVYLYGSHLNNMGEEHLTYCKTKPQALKFAKSYMRTH